MNKKLKKIFDEYNKKHWNNKLPPVNLILSSKLKDFGEYSFEKDIETNKDTFKIIIAKRLNMKQIRSTMLHEMCHHSTFIKYKKEILSGKKKWHGKEWKSEMRKVGFSGKITKYT